MNVAKSLRIRGKVQGVSFRESMRMEAARLGVTGWVRNRKDSSVEAWAQGAPESVAALLEWAHSGPRGAEVNLVETEERPFDAQLKGFTRKETV